MRSLKALPIEYRLSGTALLRTRTADVVLHLVSVAGLREAAPKRETPVASVGHAHGKRHPADVQNGDRGWPGRRPCEVKLTLTYHRHEPRGERPLTRAATGSIRPFAVCRGSRDRSLAAREARRSIPPELHCSAALHVCCATACRPDPVNLAMPRGRAIECGLATVRSDEALPPRATQPRAGLEQPLSRVESAGSRH